MYYFRVSGPEAHVVVGDTSGSLQLNRNIVHSVCVGTLEVCPNSRAYIASALAATFRL